MRIAIFSDIHGNSEALKAILDDISKKNIDEIISLGDTVALGPSSDKCLDLIIKNNVKHILGNHELYVTLGANIDDEMPEIEVLHNDFIVKQVKDYIPFLKECPMKIERVVNGKKISLQHFLFNKDLNDPYPYESLKVYKDGSIGELSKKLEADLTIVGHTHKDFEVDKLISIGSSGCTKDDSTFYIILSDEGIERVTLKYDRKSFKDIVNNIDYPDLENVKKYFFGM